MSTFLQEQKLERDGEERVGFVRRSEAGDGGRDRVHPDGGSSGLRLVFVCGVRTVSCAA